jgi:enamine deaminase RidA (YjgF/YER057c/UK114 family)
VFNAVADAFESWRASSKQSGTESVDWDRMAGRWTVLPICRPHRAEARTQHEADMKKMVLMTLLAMASSMNSVHAHDIIRHASPSMPIASSVQVPAGSDLLFLSGVLADVADPSAEAGSLERFGDTRTQALSVLGKIDRQLQAAGFSMKDVVKMNVYLVADPRKAGGMDFDGLMKAYLQFYGLAIRGESLPARTTVQVAGLPVPGALVEIEVVAARHAAH